MEARVHLEKKNKVGKVRFPPQGNSLPSDMLKKLIKAFEDATPMPTTVVILESRGNAFCVDFLKELKNVKTLRKPQPFYGLCDLLIPLKNVKFVLASVHGKIVGGGVGLVAACDYAFATNNASIKLSELSIGLGPYVIEPVVSRKIGTTAFAQLSLDTPLEKCPMGAR